MGNKGSKVTKFRVLLRIADWLPAAQVPRPLLGFLEA